MLAGTMGVNFSLEAAVASPLALSQIIEQLADHPAHFMLNMALLRSMKQAIYSATHGIHYGLASQAYTHYTSPIRRYPDLLVHRLLRQVLRVKANTERRPGPPELKNLEKELETMAEHCSYRERLATAADREAIRLKQVRMMRKRLGEVFEAKVIGMIDRGIFAQIHDPFVEGFISKESMTDDFYQFNEDKMIFYGKRKKRMFRIGDPITIRVVRADLDRREIDFALSDIDTPEAP
jgi:ribonuclease R